MKKLSDEKIFFVAAKRNPFGTYLGSLEKLSATKLGVHASKAALTSAHLAPEHIEHVIFGNVLQTSKDALYLARHIGLECEIPNSVPALTVNRLCGSGFEAIIQGARLLSSKESQCVLVGGAENLSQSPHIIRGARKGLSLGQGKLEDSLWESLNDTYVNMPMAITAENLAIKYEISQDEVDEYSVLSQTRYAQALKEGKYSDEISPIECGSSKRPQILEHDEHPRPTTTLEALKKLPKVFKADGVIHAGAASGICDGAAALIMCRESFAMKHGLNPLGELINFGIAGCDPKIMGIGPVPAIKQCLEKSQLDLADMSMIEVNEAFAPQVLAVKKELKIDENKLNIHGGAIAIGHPLGASGARISAHLLHSLKTSSNALGLGSACIGGGQGIALLIQSFL
ncbi:MAG: thiolase family protein [Myxococcales bacterium]|nr:thiolase family protein [Myxococcales bacterium]USN50567.1 MAG: thiolase family protein [Myxococcales bacterium]